MNNNKKSHGYVNYDFFGLIIVFLSFIWIPFFVDGEYRKEQGRIASMKNNTGLSTMKRGAKMSEQLNSVRRMIEEEKIHYINTGGTEEGFYAAVEAMLEEMGAENKKEKSTNGEKS